MDPSSGDSFWYWAPLTNSFVSPRPNRIIGCPDTKLFPTSPPSPNSSNLQQTKNDNEATVVAKSEIQSLLLPTPCARYISKAGEIPRSAGGELLTTFQPGDLAMSLSPKPPNSHSINITPHSTPFSVTDILSPLEESFVAGKNCLESSSTLSSGSFTQLNSPCPTNSASSSPYHLNSGRIFSSGQGSPLQNHSMNVQSSSPYTHMHVPQLSHQAAAFQAAQYCNGVNDLHSMAASHYGDVRSTATAGWYGPAPTDPRFASMFY